jgi:hypothetical protein
MVGFAWQHTKTNFITSHGEVPARSDVLLRVFEYEEDAEMI